MHGKGRPRNDALPPVARHAIGDAAREGTDRHVAIQRRYRGRPRTEPGGVSFPGGWPDVWRANLRCAARRGCLSGSARSARCTSRSSTSGRGSSLGRGAAAGRAGEGRGDLPRLAHLPCRGGGGADRDGASARNSARRSSRMRRLRVLVRIADDLCTISVDTRASRSTGAATRRRWARRRCARRWRRCSCAPAAIGGAEPVVDPMCGSGTFVLEAAEIAAGLAPGRSRAFAFERLATFDAGPLGGDEDRGGAQARPPLPRLRPGRGRGADERGQRGPRAGVADITRSRRATWPTSSRPRARPGSSSSIRPTGRGSATASSCSRHARLGAVLKERFGAGASGS
jgi:putative N6-adenine-specific DNA methylase